MCKQKTALEMLEKRADKGGLSPDALFLAEKQCEDFEMMDKRMTNLENKVDNLSSKVDNISSDISDIKEMMAIRSSFWSNLKEVISNKVFLYLLVALIAAICGVPIAQVGIELLK